LFAFCLERRSGNIFCSFLELQVLLVDVLISISNPYLSENRTLDSLSALLREIIAVYCGSYAEHVNTLCGWKAEFVDVTAGGTYCYHCVLKG
jgi:hypothetical protein